MKHPEHTTRYVTITEDEYDSMRSTIETLSDNELMESICQGGEDIKAGRTKPLNEYLKERGVI
ncbi:MAG: hypothetical protein MSIBF_04930 [Candidatus Altiarchaeales archaeon IMC4]|nr:MAG: hypothetical protein MSIBF_04930 [Candidatus Altiarchaeales archaeon IMC4]